jgi:O-antigen/teichoic acid export membrane protein
MESAPKASETRQQFFRQTTWLFFAANLGSIFMWAFHVFAPRLGKSEYGLIGMLLQVLGQLGIAGVVLQNAFVQFAARAETAEERGRLASALRVTLLLSVMAWAAGLIFTWFKQDELQARFRIDSPAVLWLTGIVALGMLWSQIFVGILQGRQNFLWFGFAQIFGGLGRLGGIVAVVFVVGGGATGAMGAILAGAIAVLAISLWQTRWIWSIRPGQFEWKPWLRRMVLLGLGFWAPAFLQTEDALVIREYFSEEQSGYYATAGTVGRGLIFLTSPLIFVLFPKMVKAAASGEKSTVLRDSFIATGIMSGAAALFLTFFPGLPIRLVQGREFLEGTYLVPWFAWAIVPLTLANVLINNLLAREKFVVVPFLVLTAIAYGMTLRSYHPTPLRIVQLLGLFSVLLLAVSALFTWLAQRKDARGEPERADLGK